MSAKQDFLAMMNRRRQTRLPTTTIFLFVSKFIVHLALGLAAVACFHTFDDIYIKIISFCGIATLVGLCRAGGYYRVIRENDWYALDADISDVIWLSMMKASAHLFLFIYFSIILLVGLEITQQYTRNNLVTTGVAIVFLTMGWIFFTFLSELSFDSGERLRKPNAGWPCKEIFRF